MVYDGVSDAQILLIGEAPVRRRTRYIPLSASQGSCSTGCWRLSG